MMADRISGNVGDLLKARALTAARDVAGSRELWAVTIGDYGGQPTGMLVRIDTATNEIAAEIPLGPEMAGYEDAVVLGAGSVWVLGVRWFEEEDAEYGSDLIRIDPATNAIAARIPVGGFHMVMGTDEMWVRFPADGVFDGPSERWLWTRVDVRTNEPSFEFEADGLEIVTPEALWSVGYDDQESIRVTRFDPETLGVVARSEPIRSYFTDAALDPASGTVWVSAVYSVVRVDIADEAAPSPSTAPPALTLGTAQHDPEGGIFILTPPDWPFLVDPSGPYEPEMLFAIASYPIEAQVLRLIRDGLSQDVAAARCGITTNHAWAIRALAGVPRPVSEEQRAIARAIVERKRREAAR